MRPSKKTHFIAFTILGIISVYKTERTLSRYFDISQNGAKVVGTVVELEKRHSSKGSNIYPVYEYQLEEKTYRGQDDQESFIPPSIGARVALTIDKRTPERLTTGIPVLWPLLTVLILWMLLFGHRYTTKKE